MKRKIMLLTGVSLMAFLNMHQPSAVAAETTTTTLTTQAAQTDSLSATRGETVVSGKISSDFTTFAGSSSNADALVHGLRTASPITLTSTTTQGGTGSTTTPPGGTGSTTTPPGGTTSTTFTAPTSRMGYGNVFITLSLAQQQLANAGITEPTPEQIKSSLLGGEVTTSSGKTVTLNGVAQMRSDGMGWGQIANTLGFKLGPVVSGIKSANANIASQPVMSTRASGAATAAGANSANAHSGTQSGIVSATGAPAGSLAGNGQGNAYGRGIVSATGGPMSVGNAGAGNGNAYGRGIVTGTGSSASTPGNSASHGKGK